MSKYLNEYLQEYMHRMSVEEPTYGRSFREWFGNPLPDDLQIAPVRGGTGGILAGYIQWLRVRYPTGADGEIAEYCQLMGAHDEADLLRKLTEEWT